VLDPSRRPLYDSLRSLARRRGVVGSPRSIPEVKVNRLCEQHDVSRRAGAYDVEPS